MFATGQPRRLFFAVSGLFLLLGAGALLAPASHESLRAAEGARPSAAADGAVLSAQELADRIDRALADSWSKAKVTPAPPATDAEFLRRVYLDLNGRIPPVAVVRAFLADSAAGKRREIVERLLSRGAHAAHLANTWRDQLLAGAANSLEARAFVPQFDLWLKLRFAAGTPYNQLVQELLTSSPAPVARRAMAGAATAPSPVAFYEANQRKPEQLAAASSRLFLGLQVQCAECHNHPFTAWKREQFWSFAALFSGLDSSSSSSGNVLSALVGDRKLKIPDTDTYVEPRFLDGSEPDWKSSANRRELLAGWLTRPDNPWFARAAVNRIWEHFFGRGLVHPVDDLDPANKPSHPELFDLLARQFVRHDFDLRYLIRALTATRAYQLSSRGASAGEDLQYFARIPLRRMSGDQLLDSLVQATGYREGPRPAASPLALDDALGSVRAEFQARFSEQSLSRTEAETSILQALAMMNGAFIARLVDPQSGGTLAAVADSPFFDTGGRIEALYLATLSRPPDADEREQMVRYVGSGGPTKDSRAALADVFWSLLNSPEFVLCH